MNNSKIIIGYIIIVLTLMQFNLYSQNVINKTNTNPIKRTALVGIWTNGQSENATFQIEQDSIYYVENAKRFQYKIINDSLIIKFDNIDNKTKIEKITKDSLILQQDNERLKFWKFKN